MTPATPKLRPPGKIHGGKSYLARRLVALMPPHDLYVEPFLGMGSVLLNKPPARREVAADANPAVVNLWRVIQVDPVWLADAMARVRFSAEAFAAACRWLDADDVALLTADVGPGLGDFEREWALRFLVRSRMSRGGLGRDFAASTRQRGGQAEGQNAWETTRAALPAVAARVRGVAFRHMDALTCLRLHGGRPGSLVYLDPPYWPRARTCRRAYGPFEMTPAAHLRLLAECLEADARVMVSNYDNPAYAAALAGWRREAWDMPNHAGQGRTKARRTEVLWMNW